eukprot:COSAG05_NODE_20093_length_283_cov_0.842391_1_plen_51_part_01
MRYLAATSVNTCFSNTGERLERDQLTHTEWIGLLPGDASDCYLLQSCGYGC